VTNARRLRQAARATALLESAVRRATAPARSLAFPIVPPPRPRGVEIPEDPPALGPDYDTDWARSPLARAVRSAVVAGPMRAAVRSLAEPVVHGHDRLADLLRTRSDGDGTRTPTPVIFAPNHHSHLDTALMVRAVPAAWRRRVVVAAAADYFFDTRWKARLSALALNAVPVDRESTGRKSADLLAGLIADGWSLVIYPEGGRSPDGWSQPFRGGAAYLAARTGAPVIPVHIDGTDSILGKGMARPKPGRTRITFGRPLRPTDGESTRRFNERIAASVAHLADEATSDFWSARRRGAEPQPAMPRRRWPAR
jgi:1-acyl-sn-glycerol-3-phosphate acyltransferase